jgi:hypothetical protein
MHIQESQRSGERGKTSSPSRGLLKVVCFSTYVSNTDAQSGRHDDVRNFLLALRGEKIEGEANIPVGGEVRRLSAANTNDSIDWFGEMVVAYLESNRIYPPFVLVPVPTSKATLYSSAGPWTSLLAISIASNGLADVEILDALRWRNEVPPPSQRTSSVAELYDNLAVTRRLDPDIPVVLVDYLFSTSATMRACAAALGQQGVRVSLALCAGRTATQANYDPFTVVAGELSEYQPGH